LTPIVGLLGVDNRPSGIDCQVEFNVSAETSKRGQNQTVANGIWLSAVQVDEQQCANQMARQLNWLRRGICD
jgi:hypothetical protein